MHGEQYVDPEGLLSYVDEIQDNLLSDVFGELLFRVLECLLKAYSQFYTLYAEIPRKLHWRVIQRKLYLLAALSQPTN